MINPKINPAINSSGSLTMSGTISDAINPTIRPTRSPTRNPMMIDHIMLYYMEGRRIPVIEISIVINVLTNTCSYEY